jgi:DNA modification methylase
MRSHNKTVLEALGRHPIHPFPARMAPGIALDALGDGKSPLRVLDPMMGSGTVLAVARARGHHAFGVDLDPLAVLLASVWTRTVNPEPIRKKAKAVLRRATREFRSLPVGRAYPTKSDKETKQFVRYWFDEYARRQLTALSNAIRGVRDGHTRDVLWCSLSRLIITKQAGASRAMDLSHSRPHRRFARAPIKPLERFLAAVETVIANCPQPETESSGPPSSVKHGDARVLPIESGSIDLVLTSPPYLNAIDYMRCSKFSLVWMGYNVGELRKIRAESVGTEASSKQATSCDWIQSLLSELSLKPALSNRDQALLAHYAWDMNGALAETSRVLRSGGRAIYVVGDSVSRGTFIPNSKIVTRIAERHGLSFVSRHWRLLPANRRYLPPPKRNSSGAKFDNRMRREVVISFQKEGESSVGNRVRRASPTVELRLT